MSETSLPLFGIGATALCVAQDRMCPAPSGYRVECEGAAREGRDPSLPGDRVVLIAFTRAEYEALGRNISALVDAHVPWEFPALQARAYYGARR